MVIRKVAVPVQSVLGHKLDDLKGAFLAVDVGDVDIRLIRRGGRGRAGIVGPETVRQNWRANRVLNDCRHGLRPSGRLPGRHFRILGKFGS
jgi:hypothetical protein